MFLRAPFQLLADVVKGRDALAVTGCWQEIVEAIRNLGWPGISSMAISAVDAALWDLKARLLGAVRAGAAIYGMGMATFFEEEGVTWFEEPVPSDDLEGLHLIRDRVPAGIEIAEMVRCSGQDAHKGHPSYGRGFEYIRDFGVKVGGYVAWIS